MAICFIHPSDRTECLFWDMFFFLCGPLKCALNLNSHTYQEKTSNVPVKRAMTVFPYKSRQASVVK